MRLTPPCLKILDSHASEHIYKNAAHILKNTGFRVYSSRIRAYLEKAGARVNDSSEIVTLPKELIEEALASCPKEFPVYNLDGNPIVIKSGSASNIVGTYCEAIQCLDYNAAGFRPSTLKDLKNALKIADSLDLAALTGVIVNPTDVAVDEQFPKALFALLTSTRKCLNFGIHNVEQARLISEAIVIASPGAKSKKRPLCLFVSSPTSPLVFDKDSGDALIYSLEHNMIPIVSPCPMAGATSHQSIIGTALQQTIENIFLIACIYAIKPGSPLLWGGAGAAMDMKAGDVSYGGIERSLMMLANIDMAGFFNIPCNSPASSVDSSSIDAQIGAEKTWTYFTRLLSKAASGVNIGAISNGKTVSLEQMIVDSEIIAALIRFTKGIETDHLETAVKDIQETGWGGNFMLAPSTLDILKNNEEYYYPDMFNKGGPLSDPMLKRAHDKVEQTLAEYKSPVPDKICGELEIYFSENKRKGNEL